MSDQIVHPHQIAIPVADRSGGVQVLLRDRFAGLHIVKTATDKACTALTFRQDTTLAFDIATAKEPRGAGARNLPLVGAVAGGVLLEAGGSILGSVGVSGAPGSEADDRCARAGVAAIRDGMDL